jgi:hypothetical protein
LLADSPTAFAEACVTLASDAVIAGSLVNCAADVVSRQYSAHSVRERVRRLVCEVLRSAPSSEDCHVTADAK